jgi:WD40 repeat protein
MPIDLEDAVVIVEQLLPNGKLSPIQLAVFRGAWEDLSYQKIARQAGYDVGHVRNIGVRMWSLLTCSFGEKVTKLNLHGTFRRFLEEQYSLAAVDVSLPLGTADAPPTRSTERLPQRQVESISLTELADSRQERIRQRIDWGEAIDASIFYGRSTELELLTTSMRIDRCRVVSICGMAGIGKTTLAVKIAQLLAEDFDRIIWISLRDAPPIAEMLDDTIRRLVPDLRDKKILGDIPAAIAALIKSLSQQHYLLIFDNFDAVLTKNTNLEEQSNYLELLKLVAEVKHNSCLLLTTREKPAIIAALAGETLPVRSISLVGLERSAAGQLLGDKGLIDRSSCDRLVKNYAGHPLALKFVAATIQDLFAGDIDSFITEGASSFDELDRFLTPQFDLLTPLAQKLLYWLAIHRTSIDLQQLQTGIGASATRGEIQAALLVLQRRSLIERDPKGFTLHPVVMEFATNLLLDKLCLEIIVGGLVMSVAEVASPNGSANAERLDQQQKENRDYNLLLDYPLMQATAAEYVRERQMRMILAPLSERLIKQLGSLDLVRKQLINLFARLRERNLHRRGYGIGNCINLCRYLQIDLTGIDLHQASIRQAYLADINLHDIDCCEATFKDCRLAQTFGSMTCVAFSPNGELLATCDANGEIQIWQVADSRRLLTLRGHDHWLWSVAFSPDGRYLVSGGQDRTARLWDLQTGACLYAIAKDISVVNHVAISPNGKLLVTCGEDSTVKLWDVQTGGYLKTLVGHERRIWSAAFYPDSQTLVTASEDGTLKVWHLETGICQRTLTGHQNWIWKVVISPDGQTIASTSYDLTIRLWDVGTGNCLRILTGHQSCVIAADFSPDGKSIATGSDDGTIKLWDLETGTCQQTWAKHTRRVWSVAFHPGGEFLASAGDDYAIRLWRTKTGMCTQLWQGYSNNIMGVASDKSGTVLATAHEAQTIELWRLDGVATIPFRTLSGHTNRLIGIAFHPDNIRLASSSCDRTIKLWDTHTGHCINTLHGHQSWVWSVTFSPDGNLLASASYDHTIKLWDPNTGVCLHTLTGEPAGAVQQVKFSPNGRWLASCGYPHTIQLWDPQTGTYLQQLIGHNYRVWSMVWLTNERLVSGGEDGTICLWDIQTGACLHSWLGHNCQVFCLEYDPNLNRLYSSDAQGNVKIWDLQTINCLATIDAHDRRWLFSFCLSPDRDRLYTSSLDGKVKIWDLATLTCLTTLTPPRPYERLQINGATGLNDAEFSTLIALGAIS